MRYLLKLSGEALQWNGHLIDPQYVESLAQSMIDLKNAGHQIAVVVGGGNIWRGANVSNKGPIERSTADYMGMLATVMNGAALCSALESLGAPARVMSAIAMAQVAEPFVVKRGLRHLEKGRIVICVAGSGNPYFTTDSAAVLRALELRCDLVVKATKVHGIYDKDPLKHSDALHYSQISYDEAMAKNIKVMDQSAIGLARDERMPLLVCHIDNIARIGDSDLVCTRVHA